MRNVSILQKFLRKRRELYTNIIRKALISVYHVLAQPKYPAKTVEQQPAETKVWQLKIQTLKT